MNYMLIMRNEESGLVAIEYQAAMLRDEIENSSQWTTVGIAKGPQRGAGPRRYR